MAQPLPRIRAERRAATRRALIACATDRFAAQGYEHATLGEIAAAANVSKGAVHHHFRAKGDLVGPVVDHCLARLERRALDAAPESLPPLAQWRTGARRVLRALRDGEPEGRALAELIARSHHDAAIRDAIGPRMATVESRIAAALSRAVDSTGLSLAASPSILAAALVTWGTGLALSAPVDSGTEDSAALFAALATLV